jgi:carbon storage regulator
MLVLTRRVGQTVVIDGKIEVKVVSLQGGKVRLGFTAPKGVLVDREEINERRRLEPTEQRDRSPGPQQKHPRDK